MPRVRFGDVHIFNSLYTASGDNYPASRSADNANILDGEQRLHPRREADPIDSTRLLELGQHRRVEGNTYSGTSGQTANKGSTAFTRRLLLHPGRHQQRSGRSPERRRPAH